MKNHVARHYKKKFFESEENKIAFIRKNANRIMIKVKEQKYNFETFARELGVDFSKEKQDNTHCFYCKAESQLFICLSCKELFTEESIKEIEIFVDRKPYDNPLCHDLVLTVMNQLKEQEKSFLENWKYSIVQEPRIQSKLDNFL